MSRVENLLYVLAWWAEEPIFHCGLQIDHLTHARLLRYGDRCVAGESKRHGSAPAAGDRS